MYISEDNSIICDSLESFLCLILNENNDAVRQETHLYFRGENKYHKYLVPNLYLDEGLTKRSSDYYYRMLLSQIGSADYSKNSELFKHMVDFQHHGAKTRLIDISANPLIALYFAVEKNDIDSSDDGYIYVFGSFHRDDRPDNNAEQFDVGHTIAVKTALSLIPQDKINSFLTTCKSIYARTSRNDWNHRPLARLLAMRIMVYISPFGCYGGKKRVEISCSHQKTKEKKPFLNSPPKVSIFVASNRIILTFNNLAM